VLATQRPHGAISDRIRTNTNLRIALRMLDRAESTDVVDDPAAARLPRDRPGRGYARFGHDELVPFQAALTEPARLRELVEQISRAAADAGVDRPRRRGSHRSPPRSRSTRSTCGANPITTTTTTATMAPARTASPWRWPWPTSPPAAPAAVALASWPRNLLVLGMPGSGTTTTLVTIALALSRRADHHRFHIHGVADGSGRLQALQGLPQVGTIVHADDVRRQGRLIRLLADELDTRRTGQVRPGRSSSC